MDNPSEDLAVKFWLLDQGYTDPHRIIYGEVASELQPNQYFSYNDPRYPVKPVPTYAERINSIMSKVGPSEKPIVDPMPLSFRNPYYDAIYQDVVRKAQTSESQNRSRSPYSGQGQQQEIYLKRQGDLLRGGIGKSPAEASTQGVDGYFSVQHFTPPPPPVHFLNKQEPGNSFLYKT